MLLFGVLVLLFVLFCGVLIFHRGITRVKHFTNIAILGPTGAGKTALLFKLKNHRFSDTVSSSVLNSFTLEIHNNEISDNKSTTPKLCRFFDVPGHPAYIARCISLSMNPASIIFVLDGSEKASVKAAAKYLHGLLTTDDFLKVDKTPILILCNKQDVVGARTLKQCREDVERELEILRSSTASMDGSKLFESDSFLDLEQSKKYKVKFLRISVLKDDLKEVENFAFAS